MPRSTVPSTAIDHCLIAIPASIRKTPAYETQPGSIAIPKAENANAIPIDKKILSMMIKPEPLSFLSIFVPRRRKDGMIQHPAISLTIQSSMVRS
jgi:hypothetical protein